VSAEPDLVDRGAHNFESELEILGYGAQAFQYASAGFVAILEAIREMSRDQPR
jgi:hypothetical protein